MTNITTQISSLMRSRTARLVTLLIILVSVTTSPVINSFSPATIVGAAPAVQGDDRFGLSWINPPGTLASDQRMRQAVDSGARWDRFPFYWNEMQPNASSPIDFSKMDAVVANDLANGFQVQGILLGAPQWAIVGGKISSDQWYQFAYQAALHYKNQVSFWEMWNEPDLLDGNGKGLFWWGSVDDYYALMKRGYQAVKAANPDAKVLMSALAFPYNNQDFFARFLDAASKDSTAAANGYYFDILPLHLYGRSNTFYDVPIGYIGRPDFAGFRQLMRNRGFEKPIWVNESGVAVWNTGTGQNAPGRATMDEQASYVIQAFGYGIVAGIDKIFFFQLYDDGAGARDPRTGQPAEYFGMVSNAGQPRPAYTAYQTAAKYLSGSRLATRVNYWRNGNEDIKGVDVITLYGTPNGKITMVWNYDGGATKQVKLNSSVPTAIRMDKLGGQQQVSAVNGAYTLDAKPATNNNNFDCYTSGGCDPNDFILGGEPAILIEQDYGVPPSTISPLPSGVKAPFTVNWRSTRPIDGARYDVQYMDPAEGVWRDWVAGTTATSGSFGTSSTPVQLNHTYVFRCRAADSSGNLVDGYDYPQNPMASTVVLGGSTSTAPPTQGSSTDGAVDAEIQIVWPQGDKPVSQATLVNIGAYLFQPDTLTAVNSPNKITLWRSLNNGIEESVAAGQKRTVNQGNLSYPVWDFNDIDVSQARDPLNKYYFRLSIDGAKNFSNVWSHGTDARTYFPNTDVPTGIATAAPTAVDAKIEIVWPQDNSPVDKAMKANIGVYLFERGTLKSVPLDFNQTVRLRRALNNDPEREVAVGQKTTKTENGITYPVWNFNDVDVSAARDSVNKYYFRVTVDGVQSFSNVWSHGKDARTYFPKPLIPRGVIGN